MQRECSPWAPGVGTPHAHAAWEPRNARLERPADETFGVAVTRDRPRRTRRFLLGTRDYPLTHPGPQGTLQTMKVDSLAATSTWQRPRPSLFPLIGKEPFVSLGSYPYLRQLVPIPILEGGLPTRIRSKNT